MNALKSGAVLQNGKYRIESVLGQGGFGITYLATQTMLGCTVAIKEFFFRDCCERNHDDSGVSVVTETKRSLVDKFKAKFLKEARMLLTINHHNIVRVMDAFEENGTAYYAMEYIEGTSLSQLIDSKGRLTPGETLAVVEPVAEALAYLHARSINHLDIKPANIMIENGTGRVLLIDFGVSKQYDPETGQSTTTTPVGVSHGYAPLEQYNNGGVNTFSPQSDIYALGATMLKMLTGTTPPNAVELSQQGGPDIPASVPRNMAAAIRAAMQPVKGNRPQTVQQFADILHNSGNGGSTTVLDGEAVNGTDGTGKNKTTVLAVLACAVIAIAVAGWLFLGHGKSDKAGLAADTLAVDSDTVAMEQPAVEDTNISTTTFANEVKGKEESTKLSVEYPVSGPDILLQNIREWISESLGGKYNGDLADGKALFDHYFGEMGREMTADEYEMYNQVTIKKVYENSKVVTFLYEGYAYAEGGAHGMQTTKGATFRKSDGRKFTAKLLDGSYKYQDEIKAGLKKYFEVSTDDALMEQLQLDDAAGGELPFPSTDPWITDRGVVFCYPPYEIACYAAGMPTFTLPASVIKAKSAATTATFFE